MQLVKITASPTSTPALVNSNDQTTTRIYIKVAVITIIEAIAVATMVIVLVSRKPP